MYVEWLSGLVAEHERQVGLNNKKLQRRVESLTSEEEE